MHHGKALTTLKETGYRLTPQRLMVLETIAGARGHVTAEEIGTQVRRTYPYIDIATIYRTLHLLKRLHLVTEIDPGGSSAQYELAGDGRHHHLICEGCGKTIDLPLAYLDNLHQSLRREFEFEADLDHFALRGRCSQCLAARTGTPRKDRNAWKRL
ncbi:MAG: transcriptional repressor [Chloroflexi bacterium]|nr:transcriptional repressor [Chloroflexota bacterium]